MTGSSYVPQMTTSRKGVQEIERQCEKAHEKQQKRVRGILREIVELQKEVAVEMELLTKADHIKLLYRAQLRAKAEQDQWKLKEQRDEIRRAFENPNTARRARIEMQAARFERERKLHSAAAPSDDVDMFRGVLDRALTSDQSPIRHLLLESVSGSVAGNFSPLGAVPFASSASLAAAAATVAATPRMTVGTTAGGSTSSQNTPLKIRKRRRIVDDDSDDVLPCDVDLAGGEAAASSTPAPISADDAATSDAATSAAPASAAADASAME